MAIAAAAAAAGIGAAAGTSPWSAAASNLAAADSTAGHHGNIFGSVPGANYSVADAEDVAKTAYGSANHTAPPAASAKTTNPVKAARAAAPTAKPAVKAPKRAAAPAKKAAPAHAVTVSKLTSQATPYSIYDSVNPAAIPSGDQQVAVYANGSYQASWADVNGRRSALWIDTTGNNPGCDALDVEPGDATPSGAASWVKSRLTQQPGSTAIVYTMRSEWQSVKDSVNGLPKAMQSKVKYWIADPTGVKHMVAGANATQWYWGTSYDITTANPGF